MRKPRPKLDPVTLRWCAEECDQEVARYDDLIRSAGNRPEWRADAEAWRSLRYRQRMHAKRLRNLATRAEGER